MDAVKQSFKGTAVFGAGAGFSAGPVLDGGGAGVGDPAPGERSFGVQGPARQAVMSWAASGHRVVEGTLAVPIRD